MKWLNRTVILERIAQYVMTDKIAEDRREAVWKARDESLVALSLLNSTPHSGATPQRPGDSQQSPIVAFSRHQATLLLAAKDRCSCIKCRGEVDLRLA